MRKFSSDEGSQQLKSTIHSLGQSRHRPIFREGCPSEIDEEILREQGQTDFEQYRYDPAGKLMTDLFVD